MFVTKRDGKKETFNFKKIEKSIKYFSTNLKGIDPDKLMDKMNLKIYNGMTSRYIIESMILSAQELIDINNTDYEKIASRITLNNFEKETVIQHGTNKLTFKESIKKGIEAKRVNKRIALLDLDVIESWINYNRDFKLSYLSVLTIIDRYVLKKKTENSIINLELIQHFFMRVACGLVLNYSDQELKEFGTNVQNDIKDFYNLFSNLEYMSSTPTLFNSGTTHSQMSSCFTNTVADCLTNEPGTHRYASIMGTNEESAIISKFAGGLGTDWSQVRHAGAPIESTGGRSSGVIPFLKIYNSVAVAADQAGKRKGSFAPYLETWHPDFLQFIDLKKESSDERLSAHDIFPVAWVNDLLMERKDNPKAVWSFFDPSKYPELHTLHGKEFKELYEKLEQEGKYVRQTSAELMWKKMITSIWETGHPWICFKDTINERNPQRHWGSVLSSNLCTEITIVTNNDETGVCNLGSVNLTACLVQDKNTKKYSFDYKKLRSIIRVAVKMLNNVIDNNFYPSERAELSNMRHRPIGLGVMGLSDVLAALNIDWESQENLEFQDELMYKFSYATYEASADLAAETSSYLSFSGSDWSKGILPYDNCNENAKRLTKFEVNEKELDLLREKVKKGMRNSLCIAIAPTATISNITNTTPCIEPIFEKEFIKGNLSGSFKVVASPLKYNSNIKTAFDINQEYVIRAAAVRQKYIDQSQSTNIFVKANAKGRDISGYYTLAHLLGLKTNYYLRRQIQIEETPKSITEELPKVCSINNPNCESCQ